jgi:uncharacterized protein YbdZ (MbtH family)
MTQKDALNTSNQAQANLAARATASSPIKKPQGTYRVIIKDCREHGAHYSIWPAANGLPEGFREEGESDAFEMCLKRVELLSNERLTDESKKGLLLTFRTLELLYDESSAWEINQTIITLPSQEKTLIEDGRRFLRS